MSTYRNKGRSTTPIILSNHRWYGDGYPHWIQSRGRSCERSCESAAEALFKSKDTIRRIYRYTKADKAAISLADRVKRCSVSYPCSSGACDKCRRAFQRWYVYSVQRLRQTLPDGDACTILIAYAVPDYGQIPVDQLQSTNIHTINRRFAREIRNLALPLVIGGIDFSLNVDHGCSIEYVQVHFQCLIFARKGTWMNRLRDLLNRSGKVRRPLLIREFDGDLAGIAYTLKCEFYKRTQYLDQNIGRDDRGPCLRTRTRPWRGISRVHLTLLLDKIGLDGRLIMLGAKRRCRNGRMEICTIR